MDGFKEVCEGRVSGCVQGERYVCHSISSIQHGGEERRMSVSGRLDPESVLRPHVGQDTRTVNGTVVKGRITFTDNNLIWVKYCSTARQIYKGRLLLSCFCLSVCLTFPSFLSSLCPSISLSLAVSVFSFSVIFLPFCTFSLFLR